MVVLAVIGFIFQNNSLIDISTIFAVFQHRNVNSIKFTYIAYNLLYDSKQLPVENNSYQNLLLFLDE